MSDEHPAGTKLILLFDRVVASDIRVAGESIAHTMYVCCERARHSRFHVLANTTIEAITPL